MKHSVIFKDRDNKWDNALPLGNGVFGCMVFYEKDRLYMPMNHYEVYYNISNAVLPRDMLASLGQCKTDGKEQHEERKRLADVNVPKDSEPYCEYTYRKERSLVMNDTSLGIGELSNSYPCTGELIFSFGKSLKGGNHSLSLLVEDATTRLILDKGTSHLQLDTIVACEDCIISKITQNQEDLLTKVKISFPEYRGGIYPEIFYKQLSSELFAYTVTRCLKGEQETKTFVFSGMVKLLGAEGRLIETEKGAEIHILKAEKEVHLVTGIFTQWKYDDPEKEGIDRMHDYAGKLKNLYENHKKQWREFFSRSSICLPDKFLEHVYYINQYALGCCSGKDGVMRHHACGLNGLWAIRHPNLWGSMWYWDVNIQAAFAGVFSSNRLDLGNVFSDGLLSYSDLMERFAVEKHGMSGYAADYPYHFYYSVVPWCAQYLWYQYEYSLDKDYLRNKAYPFFLKVCEFILQIFEYDEESDVYNVYPDISPEQGPLAHNTTITIACVKYLLQFTLEASQILEDNHPLLSKCQELLEKLPAYSISEVGNYGRHFKDSPDAPDHMWIRHPSMLMPLFPIGEFDLTDSPEIIEILSNTVDFLEERCEIGIFGGSWIAAAAARLGRGQTALRLLYERGIDHMLRSNGLTAEATERFMNYCLIMRQPMYYPCMMEFTGEMLAAVNEMLLQSNKRLIRVFPALPDGDPEYGRLLRNGYSYSDYPDKFASYAKWNDVSFERLLAKGAFEISASVKSGVLEWIEVRSRKGGVVNITSPLMTEDMKVFDENGVVSYVMENNVITFTTKAGKKYLIGTHDRLVASDTFDKEREEYSKEILWRETYTKRRIFIGEDKDSGYHKSLDGFVRDWYLGNSRMQNHTVYKFDFGTDHQKDYRDFFVRQAYAAEERVVLGMAPIFVQQLNFTSKQGFGFEDASGIVAIDRGAPDGLRRDFVEGTKEAKFKIELPRGQYEVLVVSGDEVEENVTFLECANGRTAGGGIVNRGEYQCKLIPVVQEEDEPIVLKISTIPGYRWKLNFLFLNVVKGY